MWKILGSILLAGLPSAPVQAADSAARAIFVAMHRCPVEAILRDIHRRGPVTTSRDRFIVLSLSNAPQHYVQCIFIERDTAMGCEASSGAYGPKQGESGHFALSRETRAALARLGFSLDDPAENYTRTIALGDPPEVGRVATLMLQTLFDAYGARPGTAVDVVAPNGGDAMSECGAPVS